MAVGLVLTAGAGWAARVGARQERDQRLDLIAQQSRAAVQRQVNSYAETLFGLRNLFAADPTLSRVDFRNAVTRSGIFRRFPGAQGLSFSRAVPAVKRAEYEAQVRDDIRRSETGFPDFVVHPLTSSAQHFVVEYTEPVTANEAALGFDLGTDPVRRVAIEEARDSGEVAATAPLESSSHAPGFLLFLAVYDTGQVPVTSPARRRHFVGVVSAVFQVADMLDEVLGAGIRSEIEILDVGRTVDPPARTLSASDLLFDADQRLDADEEEAGPRRGTLDLDVGSRRWRLMVFARRGLGAPNQSLPGIVAVVGLLLTFLVAGIVTTSRRSRRLAIELAGEMTASLREQERELEEANQRLARANAELSQADQAKNAFLGTISHELNTPLTAIRGFSDLLTSDAHLGERAHDYAIRITRNAGALSKLIDELLEFSRLDRGDVALSREPLSISELAPRVVDQLGPVLDGHDVQVQVEPGVIAAADPDAVTRILTNLLTNAVKFSPVGSLIRLAVATDAAAAVLSVADEGPGVPDEDRDRVFDRFYRGEAPEVAGTRGTGIGLAVVKELAERMGGSVSVENRPAAGARFVVMLPTT